MTESTHHFEHEGLVIDYDGGGEVATIRWSGVGDSRDPSAALGPVLGQLVSTLRGRSVVVDFRGLEYLSSAMVSPLIHMVKDLDAASVSTTLLFDTSVPWQKANAHCMRAIGRTLTNLHVP